MRALMIIAAALALVAGCKEQTKPDAPMVCANILPDAIDRIMADKKDDPRVAAVIERAKHDYVAVCETDKWSNDLGTCISRAKTRAEMDRCRGGLDPKQAEHFDAATRKLRAAVEQATPPPAPVAAPPAPEAAGSAGSAAGSGS
jgi:hypothetical protein